MENKEASVTNVNSRSSGLEVQAIRSFHKDKNEDADDIVFQMICKIVVSRLNVVFLI